MTHDRLIRPIRKSNQERQSVLARKKYHRNVGMISAAFIIGIILVAIPFVIIPMFHNEPCVKNSHVVLPEAGYPDDTSINEKTNMIYITIRPTSNNYPSIQVIDCTSNKVLERIAEKDASKLAVNPNTNMVYVANTASNTVSVIKDDASDKFLVFIGKLFPIYKTNLHIIKNVSVGKEPRAIAVVNPNPNTNKIYVANTGSNTVSVIDGNTNNIIHNISTAVDIDESTTIAVHPKANLIYLIGSARNQFNIIDGTTDNIIKSSITQNFTNSLKGGPTTMAINPSNDQIYVANEYFNTVYTTSR